jgi:hypothetical protein
MVKVSVENLRIQTDTICEFSRVPCKDEYISIDGDIGQLVVDVIHMDNSDKPSKYAAIIRVK